MTKKLLFVQGPVLVFNTQKIDVGQDELGNRIVFHDNQPRAAILEFFTQLMAPHFGISPVMIENDIPNPSTFGKCSMAYYSPALSPEKLMDLRDYILHLTIPANRF